MPDNITQHLMQFPIFLVLSYMQLINSYVIVSYKIKVKFSEYDEATPTQNGSE